MGNTANTTVIGLNTPFVTLRQDCILAKTTPPKGNTNYEIGTVWIYNVAQNQYTVYILCGMDLSNPSNPKSQWVQIGTNVPAPSVKAIVEPEVREEKVKEDPKAEKMEEKSKDTGVKK